VKEEVPHDQVVQVILVSVMTFVKYYQINLFHLCEAMHEQIIKLLSHSNEDIMFIKLFSPGFKLGVVFATLFLPTKVSSHNKRSVTFNGRGLLLDKILDWNNEKYFLVPTFVIPTLETLLMTVVYC